MKSKKNQMVEETLDLIQGYHHLLKDARERLTSLEQRMDKGEHPYAGGSSLDTAGAGGGHKPSEYCTCKVPDIIKECCDECHRCYKPIAPSLKGTQELREKEVKIEKLLLSSPYLIRQAREIMRLTNEIMKLVEEK